MCTLNECNLTNNVTKNQWVVDWTLSYNGREYGNTTVSLTASYPHTV